MGSGGFVCEVVGRTSIGRKWSVEYSVRCAPILDVPPLTPLLTHAAQDPTHEINEGQVNDMQMDMHLGSAGL